MPRKRIKGKARRGRLALSPTWADFFARGEVFADVDPDDPGAWAETGLATTDEVRDTWAALREAFLRRWVREYPGSRPWAWWTFDWPGEPRPDADNEPATLARLGVLTDAERHMAHGGGGGPESLRRARTDTGEGADSSGYRSGNLKHALQENA